MLQDGYAKSFKELLETTDWDQYGTGRNEQCADCMVHCGYEPTSVDHAFGSVRGFVSMVRATLFGYRSAVQRPQEARPAKEAVAGASGPDFAVELPVVQPKRDSVHSD